MNENNKKDWHCYFPSCVHTSKVNIDYSISQRETLDTQYRSFLFQEIQKPKKCKEDTNYANQIPSVFLL